jgi:murein DD-endopeptidase MepM/ murein hydrolase activator NlpD
MRQRKRHKAAKQRRGFWGRMRYAFRERQIYLRSEGEVQFITLRPWVQVFGIILLFSGLFWMAFATVNVTFKDQLLALKERRFYQARLDYEDRIAIMRSAIDGMNNRLLLNQDEYLAKVDVLRNDYEALVERHQRLGEFFRQGWLPAQAPDDGEAEGKPDSKTSPDEAQIAPGKSSLNSWSYAELYSGTFASRRQADAPLEHMRKMMAGFENMQLALLGEVSGHAEGKIKAYGKLFTKLGLNAKRIAQRSDYEPDSVGGPFISVKASDVGSQKVADSLSAATQRLILVEKLKHELHRMPLYSPLAKVKRISSRFGLRRDPFRRHMAMHGGVDFKASYGAPIMATAPGVVRRAGWEGAYGRMVEILHDNGISTRYAHMSSIKVRKGQRVKRGTIVGRLGNTGRSTGAHLHYETRIGGDAIDPVRFWKIRHAVQKISQ